VRFLAGTTFPDKNVGELYEKLQLFAHLHHFETVARAGTERGSSGFTILSDIYSFVFIGLRFFENLLHKSILRRKTLEGICDRRESNCKRQQFSINQKAQTWFFLSQRHCAVPRIREKGIITALRKPHSLTTIDNPKKQKTTT
jgi:hypothetical protein